MLGIKFLVNPIVSKRRGSTKNPWFAGVLFSILFTACAPQHGSPLWFVSQPYASRDAWLVEQCSFNSIDNAKLEGCKAALAKEMWAQGEVQNAERQERRKKMAQAFAEGFSQGAREVQKLQRQEMNRPSLMTGDQLNRSNGVYTSFPEDTDYTKPCRSQGEFESGSQLKTCRYSCANGVFYKTVKSWRTCPMNPS